MKRIFIYGTGNYASEVYKKIKKKNCVIGFLDSDKKKKNKKKLYKKIYSLEVLDKVSYDKIYVASMWSSDIMKLLISKKIPKSKIYIYPISLVQKKMPKNKNWLKLFNKLINLFNKHNVQYHLDHSSLLGMIRDKNIYDSDIDIAIKQDQFNLIKKIIVQDKDFKNIECGLIDVPKLEFGKQFIYQIKINKTIDLMLKKKIGKKYFWIVGSKILNCDQKYFDKLKKIKFNKIYFNIPFFCKKYLSNLYGRSWWKSKANWTYDDYCNIYSTIKFKNFNTKKFK